MAKNIPEIQIGNEIYEIRDATAREHMIEARDDQPTSEDNKLWIKSMEHTYLVPEYEEFEEVRNTVDRLNAHVLTTDEIDAICK